MRIGVDVGGTNTDAVVMDGSRVVAATKRATTADIGGGISAAIRRVLDDSGLAGGPDPGMPDRADQIDGVTIGTTHFTNAFVERRRLLEVAVVRAALPAGSGLPPLTDWPADLAAAIGENRYQVAGGYEYDGREIAPLDERAVLEAARDIRRRRLSSVAVSSIFAPINASMEERIAEILRQEIPDVSITLSSEIGRIGMLERENAAIINASLAELSAQVIGSLHRTLADLELHAPLFLTQNDGTLMNAETAEHYPVLTFASGPTNSMRGAAFLSGVKDAMVIDIGGTTTDVGALAHGFPRESALAVDFGGVRTNFRMPDILAIGLGGGSRVRGGDEPAVGPDSVGYRLTDEALVFGGDTLTATDVAVAAGLAEIGDPAAVSHLDPALVEACRSGIRRRIEDAVDRMRTSADALPVILVGGGAILVDGELAGASRVSRPEHSAVANAIGAAIAQVGGEVDRVYAYEELGRDQALETAHAEARRAAVAAGADERTVEIVDVDEIPLAYMPGGAVRLRVKAVGEMKAREKPD